MPELALYQPDIPQNFGSMLRLGACFGVKVHVIEPCGFPLDDKRMKRGGLDYIDLAQLVRHKSWEAFLAWKNTEKRRLILMTTKATHNYTDFAFEPNDIILMGRESAGAPEAVHAASDQRLTILMHKDARSFNVGMAAAIVLSEAIRQTGGVRV